MKRIPIIQELIKLSDDPLYDVFVNLGDLRGPEGNAYSILGKVEAALKKNESAQAAADYCQEAKSGDYRHLLEVTGKFVDAVATGIPPQYYSGSSDDEDYDDEDYDDESPDVEGVSANP